MHVWPRLLHGVDAVAPEAIPSKGASTARRPQRILSADGWSGRVADTKKVAPPNGEATFSYEVELRGLEPLTLCMPCRCATSYATAPRTFIAYQTPPPDAESDGGAQASSQVLSLIHI